MSQLIASSYHTLIVGLGATGLSVARHLRSRGESFSGADTAARAAATFAHAFPEARCYLGPFDTVSLEHVSRIVLSPGVPRSEALIQRALASGIEVTNDIALFRQATRAPLVAITGSNGKSTVTTLVGEMARAAGLQVGVGGNLGPPALDLLTPERQLYVLELSSFQLETCGRLNPRVATVLNVAPDHLDRYPSFAAYALAKQAIYQGAEVVVVNRADSLTEPPLATGVKRVSFGLNAPDIKDYGLAPHSGGLWLTHGLTPLVDARELRLRGRHNWANALAALALAAQVGISREAALAALAGFTGLSHRCQWVAARAGVEFIDDSKATNVGATLAALDGLRNTTPNLILIAGGRAKKTDFGPLKPALASSVKALVSIGESGPAIAALMPHGRPVVPAGSMGEAVRSAYALAQPGDCVLLSPACASFDMFENFEDRGRQFSACAREVCADG